MIRDYSGFVNLIKEGSSYNPTTIYWKSQFENVAKFEWKNIQTKNYNYTHYEIIFESEEENYNFYDFLIEKNSETFLVDDNINTQDIKDKLKHAFWENAQENIKNLKYKPKFLGDLEHVEKADKYNL